MKAIIFPDDTLPSFNYLDQLSEVSEDDLIVSIKDWEKRHEDIEFKNILEAEINNE